MPHSVTSRTDYLNTFSYLFHLRLFAKSLKLAIVQKRSTTGNDLPETAIKLKLYKILTYEKITLVCCVLS